MVTKWLYRVSTPVADNCNEESINVCIRDYILPYLNLEEGQYVKAAKNPNYKGFFSQEDKPRWEFWVCEGRQEDCW